MIIIIIVLSTVFSALSMEKEQQPPKYFSVTYFIADVNGERHINDILRVITHEELKAHLVEYVNKGGRILHIQDVTNKPELHQKARQH